MAAASTPPGEREREEPRALLEARRLLSSHFGHSSFRPGQELVLSWLLRGRSALAVFPTGSGKSVLYQMLPLLEPRGLHLVVSPLLALQKDQVDALARRGLPARALNSALGEGEAEALLERLDEVRLLFVAPERLASHAFAEALRGQRHRLRTVAVDEAHCVSEWGASFRPQYLKVARHARELRPARVLLLTATATARAVADMRREFGVLPEHTAVMPPLRPNLRLLVTAMSAASGGDTMVGRSKSLRAPSVLRLVGALEARPPGAAVVYVHTQRQADDLAALLGRRLPAGRAVLAYHAGMETAAREAAQERFMASADAVVVATIAFGMGIDKRDIRQVYHLAAPASLEAYAQQVGRAGRDGLPSVCEAFLDPRDVSMTRGYARRDAADRGQARALAAWAFAEAAAARGGDGAVLYTEPALAQRLNVSQRTVAWFLVLLDVWGWVEELPHRHAEIMAVAAAGDRPARAVAAWRRQAAAGTCPRARESCELVARLVARADGGGLRKGRFADRCALAVADADARALGVPRERLLEAVADAERAGALEAQPRRRSQAFRARRESCHYTAAAAEEAGDRLYAEARARAGRDTARAEAVLDLADTGTCVNARLAAHFAPATVRDSGGGGGGEGGACGRCSSCEAGLRADPTRGREAMLAELARVRPGKDDLARLAACAAACEARGVRDPRMVASFAAGMSAPALTAARLFSTHELFGEVAHLGYDAALDALSLDRSETLLDNF